MNGDLPDFTPLVPFEQAIARDAGAVEDRLQSIAATLHEARKVAETHGLPWERWFAERVKPALNLKIGDRHARRLIGYAKADDPAAAIEADRAALRERMAAHRADARASGPGNGSSHASRRTRAPMPHAAPAPRNIPPLQRAYEAWEKFKAEWVAPLSSEDARGFWGTVVFEGSKAMSSTPAPAAPAVEVDEAERLFAY